MTDNDAKATAGVRRLTQASFFAYHHFTKHTLESLSSSGHHLDWANQPDPFRKYAGASIFELAREIRCLDYVDYFEALRRLTEGVAGPSAAAADAESVSALLYYSMAVSAWKQIPGTESKWALRVNPSSGNLHPTETHLLIGSIDGIEPGAYHYSVSCHRLECRQRTDHTKRFWDFLGRGSDTPPIIIIFTSIFWREAWKYRDRAYRYCHHDLGHALAAITLSASILDWQAEIVGEFADLPVGRFLGLPADERPSLIIGLRPTAAAGQAPSVAPPGVDAGHDTGHDTSHDTSHNTSHNIDRPFEGEPNRLSSEILAYPSIDFVYASTLLSDDDFRERLQGAADRLQYSGFRPESMRPVAAEVEAGFRPPPSVLFPARALVRRRRSAVDLDGRQRMSVAEVGTILTSATRGFGADFQRPTAWAADAPVGERGHHLIHLYIYAHRVDGLTPGIYYYDRMVQTLTPLVEADERQAAKFGSCFQDIAADGCFAVSMVADLGLAYELYGDRGYRYVHFEAGAIGQWLYLGATALGYEATGIGCFVDDIINTLLGLPLAHQVVYNFTIGRAVEDIRLTTLPAYDFPDPTR